MVSVFDPESVHVLELVNTIYDAALYEGGWQTALDTFHRLMPETAVTIYGYDYANRRAVGEICAGYDPEAIQAYGAYYAPMNPHADGFGKAPTGTLLEAEDLIPREDLINTEYYNDWMRPQDGQITGIGSLIVNESGRFLAWSANLTATDEDRSRVPLIDITRLLIPHLDRSFRLARTLSQSQPDEGVVALLEAISAPAMLMDRGGKVRVFNAAFANLMRSHDLVDLSANGSLRFVDPNGRKKLLRSLAEVQKIVSNGPTQFEVVGSAGSAAIEVSPFVPGLRHQRGELAEYFSEAPVAIVTIRPTRFDLPIYLGIKYRLTSAETAVALAIMRGEMIAEIACARETSERTVRQQIKSIFAKMGVNRQAELVAVLHSEVLKHVAPDAIEVEY